MEKQKPGLTNKYWTKTWYKYTCWIVTGKHSITILSWYKRACALCRYKRTGKGKGEARKYCMIYRGPGILAVVWFGPSSTPSPSPVSKLSLLLPVCRRSSLPAGYGVWGGGGRGWGRSLIFRRQESLVLYKSFNTLWVVLLLNKLPILHDVHIKHC